MITVDPSAGENGLALMLAQLIEENLKTDAKRCDFRSLGLRVGIVAADADVRLTMVFGRGSLTVYDGLREPIDVEITTASEKVTSLSLLPVRRVGPLRLPNFLAPEGRQMVRDLLSGGLKIRGLLRHPLAVTRLTRLFSVDEA